MRMLINFNKHIIFHRSNEDNIKDLQAPRVVNYKYLKRVENVVFGRGKYTLTCKGRYLLSPESRAAIALK